MVKIKTAMRQDIRGARFFGRKAFGRTAAAGDDGFALPTRAVFSMRRLLRIHVFDQARHPARRAHDAREGFISLPTVASPHRRVGKQGGDRRSGREHRGVGHHMGATGTAGANRPIRGYSCRPGRIEAF